MVIKKKNWTVLFLVSIFCLMATRIAIFAQDVYPLETPELVTENNVSDISKTYSRMMAAVYLQRSTEDLTISKQLYDQLVNDVEDSAFVWYKRAQLRYQRLQDIRGAEKDIEKALEIDPSHVPATWQLAQILAHRASYSGGRGIKKLVETLKRVTELDSDHFMAHRMLSDISFQLQDFDTAEKSFKALTRIVPFDPQYHKSLGDIYKKQKKIQEAIDAYQRVIKIKPNDLNVLNTVGYIYYDTGKIKQAQETFMKAVEVEPNNVDANIGLGLVLENLAYEIQALKNKEDNRELIDPATLIQDAERYLGRAIFFSKEILNNPKNDAQHAFYLEKMITAQYALANVYIIFEKLENAEDAFKQLLAEVPDHIGATYGIGSVYQSMGNFEMAETYLRKTLTMEPAHEIALNALGYLYAQQGIQLDEAEALIKRALKKSPTNGAYLDSLGWVFYKQGKFAEAVRTLEEANQQAPNNAEILMHLGDAYLKNGEPGKAQSVWEQAKTIEPDNEEIHERLNQ
ncbi:tetratricopeptide repeat protein [Candidatus Poribacteria bacterium]|nr:tetratricopeptide repeat protein [Candidatus Poribacteria bacterium]